MRKLTALAWRGMFWAGSFHYIKFKGKQATSKEAPVLVLGPHSSFVDLVLIYLNGTPTGVAKAEMSRIPIIGSRFFFSL